MARTIRSNRITKPKHERTMPTRPRISLAVSHAAFTAMTEPTSGGVR